MFTDNNCRLKKAILHAKEFDHASSQMDISMAKNYDHLFKVLLIGDPAVGKTCILCRFANDEFKTTHLSTIGIL